MKKILICLLGFIINITLINSMERNGKHAEIKNTPDFHQLLKYAHTNEVTIVIFSPCGKYLVSGSLDSTIKIWNMDLKNSIITLDKTNGGHTLSVSCLAYSPNGNFLASGSHDKKIKIWDMSSINKHSIECIKTIDNTNGGHNNIISSLSYSPCSKYLASGSWDTNLIIWNADPSHSSFMRPRDNFTNASSVRSAVFSSDSKSIIYNSENSITIQKITEEKSSNKENRQLSIICSKKLASLLQAGCIIILYLYDPRLLLSLAFITTYRSI